MALRELVSRLPGARLRGAADPTISAIAIDSREVQSGTLFAALRGRQRDGHQYVAEAIARGAAAILSEREIDGGSTPVILVEDSMRALSRIAAEFYGNPSRDLLTIGVTGTNGKTTTVQMIAAIMDAARIPCATIGTLGAQFGERAVPLKHTTPFAPRLHRLLHEFRGDGARGAAVEVSSHALAQHRADDVTFAVGALTNVTRDHLDFHQTVEAYVAAKRRLFELARRCVFNVDDEHGRRWANEFGAQKPVLTYGIGAEAAIRPQRIRSAIDGSTFDLADAHFSVRLPGEFNIANALCAIACARSVGISDAESARGLETVQRVAGRTDQLSRDGVRVVVDYAHTPDALDKVLRALREHGNDLFLVFGCGGDRDRGKRPEMGAVAARFADYVYVTSDNPRSEDPAAIAADIVKGLDGAPHTVELDRRAAIDRAIARSRRGDTVLIAGKGHEAYQIVGARVLPFDDLSVARAALERRAAVAP